MDDVMGGTKIKGVVSLIVGLIYVLDYRGWPLLNPFHWGTFCLINVDYIESTISDKTISTIGGIGHL